LTFYFLQVTQLRRSNRANRGTSGRLDQFTNIERVQTTNVPQKKVNPVLQLQPVNALAPQTAKWGSKSKACTVEDPAAVESGSEAIPLVNLTHYLGKPGGRYGFVLPATGSKQHEGASDQAQVSGNDGDGTMSDEDDEEAMDTRMHGQSAGVDDEDDEESDKGNEDNGTGEANQGDSDDGSFDPPTMDIDDGNRK
jgi:hypothetical protein